ncbi:reverse transcriptase domain-containing protein [Planctomycetaceae bacterium SH139]
MKNKEEPSAHLRRRNPSRQVDLYHSGGDGHETTGSLSRPGSNVAARAEQPALVDGTYTPGAVRQKSIAKPDGGQRLLGIPNIVDRLIQQAIVQVLTPIFDPHFSDSSHGFRPRRSAHGASKQVRATICRGYRYAADFDLSKFVR